MECTQEVLERIYRGYKSFGIYHLTSPVLTRFIENIKTQSELELSTVFVAALHSRPMLDTDSALLDMFAAPFLAAELHSRPMLVTDSALLDTFAAPFLAAEVHSRPMLVTDSAFYDTFAAPFLAAEFGFVFPRTTLLVMPHA